MSEESLPAEFGKKPCSCFITEKLQICLPPIGIEPK